MSYNEQEVKEFENRVNNLVDKINGVDESIEECSKKEQEEFNQLFKIRNPIKFIKLLKAWKVRKKEIKLEIDKLNLEKNKLIVEFDKLKEEI